MIHIEGKEQEERNVTIGLRQDYHGNITVESWYTDNPYTITRLIRIYQNGKIEKVREFGLSSGFYKRDHLSQVVIADEA